MGFLVGFFCFFNFIFFILFALSLENPGQFYGAMILTSIASLPGYTQPFSAEVVSQVWLA